MSDVLTDPKLETVPPEQQVREQWVFRFTKIRVPRQPQGQQRPLPPLPESPGPYNAARTQAQPALDAAALVQPTTPTITTAKNDFTTRLTAVDREAAGQHYANALNLLPGTVAAARTVVALDAAARETARQTDGQKAQYDDMKVILDSVTDTYFNPNGAGSSQRLGKDKSLNAGKHFKDYLAALAAMEQSRARLPKGGGPFPPNDVTAAKQDAEALMAAAQTYLAHFDSDLSSSAKRDKANQRKFQIVTEGLKSARHFALAMDFQSIGEPTQNQPWDRDTELQAGAMRATISFETGYKKGGNLNQSGQGGVSQAFWIEQRPPGSTKPTKDFLFKPMQGEGDVHNSLPQGSGAVRESLAFANSKLFAQQTGIDLGIPQTHVVTIGAHALDLKEDDDDGQPRTGSLQEFAPSDGSLRALSNSARRAISPKECQRIALHDIMALNFDRHNGNLLVQTDPNGGPPHLVPIDHGGSLPTRQAFDEGFGQRIGGVSRTPGGEVSVQNAMLSVPGTYEPLDPDTLAKLDQLDPIAMVQGMRDQVQALDRVNPGLGAQGKLSEESLHMSKRSMQFLKLAAKELSPAEIQIAIGQHGTDLFDADDQDFAGVAARIITDMKPKKAAYQEIFSVPNMQRQALFDTLEKNGWTPAHGDLATWVMAEPETALLLVKSGIVNPNAPPNNRKSGRATAQDVQTALAGMDKDQALRKSVGTLVASALDALQDVDTAQAGQLNALRKEIKDLLAAGDVKGAEAKARDLAEQALALALAALRDRGAQLYAQRDTAFAGMGTDEEEKQKQAAAKPGPARNRLATPHNRRILVDNGWNELQATTGGMPNIEEARKALAKIQRNMDLGMTVA